MTSEPNNKSTRPTTVHRPRRKHTALLMAIIGATAAMSCLRCNSTETSPRVIPASKPASQPATNPVANNDARFRKLVLGVWADEYKGKRTMTIRPDGTATMIVELDGLTAIMFASKLRFDMVWSIKEGRLKKRTVGGKPAGRVRLILTTMGDRVDEPILELTEKRLLLLDADGKTKYDWRRVE
ncbi:MAG: hypothetical protein QGH60_16925 [Phycisphaerae bacterium]|jgi:hypothetical protein|nr:hypothetical protein [Phycisphaerae bacterium]